MSSSTRFQDHYRLCLLCPHRCGVDRSTGELGRCGETAEMRIAFAGIHRGEEPCISVDEPGEFSGSGTIFFSGCPMGCSFCQNIQLSGKGSSHMGREVTCGEFAQICLRLEQGGAANINLVTGTQFIPTIREGLQIAREKGLLIPVVWNTSSFESPEGLELLDEFVDVYLADCKAVDRSFGRYGELAVPVIDRFVSSRPPLLDGQRLVRGTIVRHLVMPGAEAATREVLETFGRRWKQTAILSLMIQYVSVSGGTDWRMPSGEYDRLMELLGELDIDDGFIQEPGDDEVWIPDFSRINPFPSEYADPLWHWSCGFTDG